MVDSDRNIARDTTGRSGLEADEVFNGKWRVLSVLGSGGVSTVYKARSLADDRLVAIKVISAGRMRDEELIKRFMREARMTSRLDHPNAVKVYEWGLDERERPFMVIEYLDGESLDRRIARHRGIRYKVALGIMQQICSAVSKAHSLGIIHRDLKPGNIMLICDELNAEMVKVVDFGIAKLETPAGDEGGIKEAALTRDGAIMGTPLYMAPEQLRGKKADVRSDIYSLGLILYEMLTGIHPFSSRNTAEIVIGHLNQVPSAPFIVRADLAIPETISQVAMWALAKNPWERPVNVEEFQAALERCLEEPGPLPEAAETASVPASTQPLPEPELAGGISNRTGARWTFTGLIAQWASWSEDKQLMLIIAILAIILCTVAMIR